VLALVGVEPHLAVAERAERLAVAPAVTMLLVAGLHDPDWLVEIEAVAAA